LPKKDLLAALRGEAREAPESGIVEVFNYGRGREGLIPLWVGEGDLPTPQFICDAAVKSLRDGETFYTWQRGIPELRAALAAYHARHYSGAFLPEQFFITGGGMQAIQIASRMVCRQRRRSSHTDAGVAQFHRGNRDYGGAPGRSTDVIRQRGLEARSRPTVRRRE
jgi:hypothetical protein